MVREAAERLAEFARDQCGEQLRTVTYLNDGEWSCLYLRDDLGADYCRDTYARAADRFRADAAAPSAGDTSLPLGERKAVVYYHDNAFVVQCPVPPAGSVLVSVETVAGQRLLTFIEQCSRAADGEDL